MKAVLITMEALNAYLEEREIPQILKIIVDSGSRVTAIINNILNFSRKKDSSFSSQNPVELLENALNLAATDFSIKNHYDFKSILIEKQYEKNLPNVICEGNKIQQVLLNILNNGSHAMFDSEGPSRACPLSKQQTA